MREQLIGPAEILGCILAGWFIITWMRGQRRDAAFAVLNLAAVYLFFFHGRSGPALPMYCAYLALIVFQYGMLRLFAKSQDRKAWIAFFAPIAALISVRYTPVWLPPEKAGHISSYLVFFIGISYLAFRSSYLVLEIRNSAVPMPGFFRYAGFCFFFPTILVGPINPYANHLRAFSEEPPSIPARRAGLRILVGLVKYKFIGNVFFRMTYSYMLLDDHYHPWIDLPVAMIFYYLFLYCNFSGFCDMAIGAAGLMGVPVAENFDNPFAARNVKDFWNRWHITLSTYMRDVVFAPLSKFLVRRGGPAQANHAIALTIAVVFLLVGIWHGVGWNYAAFGAAHALGVVAVHYYTLFLKKRLGRDGFKAYNASRLIHAVAVVLTFCYVAASLFLFANTFPQMKQIFSVLR